MQHTTAYQWLIKKIKSERINYLRFNVRKWIPITIEIISAGSANQWKVSIKIYCAASRVNK